MRFSKSTKYTVVFVLILLICIEAKRKGKKYSGKCKSKIMAEYELVFHGLWSESVYPRMYPKYRPLAQWSKLIGRSHSDEYTMWSEGDFASKAAQDFAENSDTRGFDLEAQAYGGIKDSFTAAPIRGGMGKTATNFITDGSHTKISFMVKLIPSPDWFVGISALDLCERNRWRNQIKFDLYPMDAGTDRGLTFTSPDWPSEPKQEIYRLSPTMPNHLASSFYYTNMTSLPPIGTVYLSKISEYRRKGKMPPPLKQERNLVIFDTESTIRRADDMIPELERIIDRTISKSKEVQRNEIIPPRAEPFAMLREQAVPDPDDGCLVSEWGDWTICSVTCGYGRQERRRTIIRRPRSALPGTFCPVLREDRTCGSSKACRKWTAFSFLNRDRQG